MVSREVLQAVVAAALQYGGDFAEVFLEEKLTTGIRCEANRIERVVSGRDIGAGIRVVAGDKTAYSYTNELTPEGLHRTAAVVARAARGGESLSAPLVRQQPPCWEMVVDQRPDAVAIDAKVELVQRVNKQARSRKSRIRQVTVGYGDVVQRVTICNNLGVLVSDERIRVRLAATVVAADRGIIQTGTEIVGGLAGLELLEGTVPEQVGQAAADRAVLLLEAKPAPAGAMPVVLSGTAGGTMVHEACGHGLEADLVQKQLSVYRGKIGQQVAAPGITVIDDATLAQRYGSFLYDDEGVPAQRTVLIQDGILQEYMYDLLTSRKEGRVSTGNGRRESYQYRPLPRMTNTMIAPGSHDPEAIIAATAYGLLVKKMGGGQVNTTNGDFVFEVAEGYLIEQGQVTVPVRGATLTGNGPSVLLAVDMVGNDLGYAIGTCGKDGQGAPVADAQPTLRIPQLVVGGVL